jgi:hypothetical protein
MKNRNNRSILLFRNIFFALFSLIAIQVSGQEGKIFPEMDVKLIDDQEINLPDDSKGKVTLVAVAYSKKSDRALTTWYNPMYRTFIDPPKGGFIPMFDYDVNLYFVALLGGLKKAANGKIESAMSKNMDPNYHSLAGLSNVQLKAYKKLLGLSKKDVPMFYVLDKGGKVVYKTEGEYTKIKLAEIEKAIQSAGG